MPWLQRCGLRGHQPGSGQTNPVVLPSIPGISRFVTFLLKFSGRGAQEGVSLGVLETARWSCRRVDAPGVPTHRQPVKAESRRYQVFEMTSANTG
jgi:hypothetical protein